MDGLATNIPNNRAHLCDVVCCCERWNEIAGIGMRHLVSRTLFARLSCYVLLVPNSPIPKVNESKLLPSVETLDKHYIGNELLNP